METMVASDKTNEAQKCFEEIREKYEKINKSVDVGNTVVDSILSDAVRRPGAGSSPQVSAHRSR